MTTIENNKFAQEVLDAVKLRFEENLDIRKEVPSSLEIDELEEIISEVIDDLNTDKTDEEEAQEVATLMNEAFGWLTARVVETGHSRLFHQYDGRRETDEGYHDDHLSVEFLNGLVGDNEEVNYAEDWLADNREAYTYEDGEVDEEDWNEFTSTSTYKEVLEIEKRDPRAVVYIESDGFVNDMGKSGRSAPHQA